MAYIIGIEGGYGTGKTLTGVIKGTTWALASGAKLFANFPLRGAYLFDHWTDWYRIADAHGSILIFDESQANWDNRQWARQGQAEQTQVINYVRKMNSLFIFILPNYNNVESRIRQMTDILIRCSKTKNDTIINHIYDYQEKRLLNKWVLPRKSQEKIFKLNLYRTGSMVSRFPLPPQNKMDEFFKELDRRHEDAMRRVDKNYVPIETLPKEELEYAIS